MVVEPTIVTAYSSEVRGPVIMVHRVDVIITNCISVAVRLMLPNISLTEYARIVTVPTCHVLVVDCPRPI